MNIFKNLRGLVNKPKRRRGIIEATFSYYGGGDIDESFLIEEIENYGSHSKCKAIKCGNIAVRRMIEEGVISHRYIKWVK